MFSDNREISARQAGRLTALYLFGMTSLFLPQILAESAGKDGAVSILLAMALGAAWLRLMSRVIKRSGQGYLNWIADRCGKMTADLTAIFYYVQFLLFGAFAVRTLGELVGKTLLPGEDGFVRIVMATILAAAALGCTRGLEERGRLAEVLAVFVFFPLVILLALAAKDVNLDYMAPFFTDPAGNILKGAWKSLVVFSIFTVFFFLIDYAKDRKKACRAAFCSAALIGAADLIIYLLCLGTFGEGGLKASSMPVVKLMTSAKIPGSFFERWDPFLVVIWILSLFCFAGACLFYGGRILDGLIPIRRKNVCLIPGTFFMYLLAVSVSDYGTLCESFESYMCHIGAPILFGLPTVFLLIDTLRGKRRRTS